MPLLTGLAADRFGLPHALFVPVVCYVWILAYGLLVRSGRLDAPPLRPAGATLH